jgi:hypothetical protein
MSAVFEDVYGHRGASSAPVALAAAAVGVVTAGSISGTTNAGAAPTVTAVTADDTCGSFTLTAVTGGGAQAAGAVANVTFAQPYARVPKAIVVTVNDQAAGTLPLLAAAVTVTITGFQVSTTILTTAHLYTVQYKVEP